MTMTKSMQGARRVVPGTLATAAFLLLAGAGCGSQEAAQAPGGAPPGPGYRQQPRPTMSAPQGRTRQEAFLGRIKNAARSNGVIREARMNGDDELGIVFGSNVKLKQIKPLMLTLLREMRDEFPGRALTIRAYAPNAKEMAVMRYNPKAPGNTNTTFTPAPGLR